MNDLFKKLNTLVKASINDILGGDDSTTDTERRQKLTPERLGKGIDREVAHLRQKVNEALEHETRLEQQLTALDEEIARWDKQADESVAQGKDEIARYAIEQMQRAERRRTMTASDLNEHRLVTQELIQRVNMLDAAVADAQRRQAEQQQAAAPASTDMPASPQERSERPMRAIAEVLGDAREKIAQMGDLITAKEEVNNSARPAENAPAGGQEAIDSDLERRRQRLSK